MAFPLRWDTLLERCPLLLYAAAWTALLTAAVAATSVLPQVAFVWAVAPASLFSRRCEGAGDHLRVPPDVPGEVLCLPAGLFGRSKLDPLVPPVFAALAVAAAAWWVLAIRLWEDGDEEGAVVS